VTFVDDSLREGAALHQPNEEEEAVDPHFETSPCRVHLFTVCDLGNGC
jgi:hypothetical protein